MRIINSQSQALRLWRLTVDLAFIFISKNLLPCFFMQLFWVSSFLWIELSSLLTEKDSNVNQNISRRSLNQIWLCLKTGQYRIPRLCQINRKEVMLTFLVILIFKFITKLCFPPSTGFLTEWLVCLVVTVICNVLDLNNRQMWIFKNMLFVDIIVWPNGAVVPSDAAIEWNFNKRFNSSRRYVINAVVKQLASQ